MQGLEEEIHGRRSDEPGFKHKKFLRSRFEEAMMVEANFSCLDPQILMLGHSKLEKVNPAPVQPPLPPNPPPPDTPPMIFNLKQEVEDEDYKPIIINDDVDVKPVLPKTDPTEADKPIVTMCRNFARGTCKKGLACIFVHELILAQLPGVYTFCRNFQNSVCSFPKCKFVHATVFEKEHFYRTGYLPPHTLAHLKADATANGAAAVAAAGAPGAAAPPPPPPQEGVPGVPGLPGVPPEQQQQQQQQQQQPQVYCNAPPPPPPIQGPMQHPQGIPPVGPNQIVGYNPETGLNMPTEQDMFGMQPQLQPDPNVTGANLEWTDMEEVRIDSNSGLFLGQHRRRRLSSGTYTVMTMSIYASPFVEFNSPMHELHDPGEPLAKKCNSCPAGELSERLLDAQLEQTRRRNQERLEMIAELDRKTKLITSVLTNLLKTNVPNHSQEMQMQMAPEPNLDLNTMSPNNNNLRSMLAKMLMSMDGGLPPDV